MSEYVYVAITEDEYHTVVYGTSRIEGPYRANVTLIPGNEVTDSGVLILMLETRGEHEIVVCFEKRWLIHRTNGFIERVFSEKVFDVFLDVCRGSDVVLNFIRPG